jgi:hypothetical protein
MSDKVISFTSDRNLCQKSNIHGWVITENDGKFLDHNFIKKYLFHRYTAIETIVDFCSFQAASARREGAASSHGGSLNVVYKIDDERW